MSLIIKRFKSSGCVWKIVRNQLCFLLLFLLLLPSCQKSKSNLPGNMPNNFTMDIKSMLLSPSERINIDFDINDSKEAKDSILKEIEELHLQNWSAKIQMIEMMAEIDGVEMAQKNEFQRIVDYVIIRQQEAEAIRKAILGDERVTQEMIDRIQAKATKQLRQIFLNGS